MRPTSGSRMKLKRPKKSATKAKDPLEKIRGDERRRPDGRFPKGRSGNYRGGPCKAETWKGIISEIMAEEGLDGVRRKEKIARRVAELAEAGVPWAVDFCADREEGKAAQTHIVDAPHRKGPDLSKVKPEVLELLIKKLASGGGA